MPKIVITRLNPYSKIFMVILIGFVFQGEIYANETGLKPGTGRIISLDDAIRIGLKNNKTFLLKSEEMKMSAQNSYLDARAEYSRPSIDSSVSISKEKELKVNAKQKFLISKTGAVISLENSYNFLKEKADTTIGINLSQHLSPQEFLVNKRILRDIEDDYNLSLRALKSDKENFISEIINSYLNLIRQKISIERSRKNIETRDELLLIADLKYKAGEIPKIDIMDMELQNKLDNINILTTEDNYRKSKKEFLKILGLDAENDFMITQTIKPFLDRLPTVNEAIAKAKNYQLFESKLFLERKEESLKEAQLSKNLSVFLEAGYSTQLPFDSSIERKNESQVGIKMEFKIYDRGMHKRTIIQLQKQLEIERHNFQELNKKITDEIQEIYKEIDLIKQKMEILSGMDEISHSLLESGNLKFKMGMISQTELNAIVERYNKTNEEVVNIQIENFLIGVRLLSLTGEIASFFIQE